MAHPKIASQARELRKREIELSTLRTRNATLVSENAALKAAVARDPESSAIHAAVALAQKRASNAERHAGELEVALESAELGRVEAERSTRLYLAVFVRRAEGEEIRIDTEEVIETLKATEGKSLRIVKDDAGFTIAFVAQAEDEEKPAPAPHELLPAPARIGAARLPDPLEDFHRETDAQIARLPEADNGLSEAAEKSEEIKSDDASLEKARAHFAASTAGPSEDDIGTEGAL